MTLNSAAADHEYVGDKLSCFDIAVYPANERKSPNPEYDNIKSSIEVKGVEQTLHVMFHPELQKWVLSKGGQTRLKICQELYDETKDELFLYPPVIKQDFTSDLDICGSHLIENELRGATSFLEKSYALQHIKHLISEDEGKEPSQEHLADQMSKLGFPIRRSSITAMLYAVELLPEISNPSFKESLSGKVTEGIRSIRKEVEDEIGNDQFDYELVDFINETDGKVSLKMIKDNFVNSGVEPGNTNTKQSTYSNKALASSVCESFALDSDVIVGSDLVKSGFLVSMPEEGVHSEEQAQALFYLISLSGVFTECNEEANLVLGQRFENCLNEDNLVKEVCASLELDLEKISEIPVSLLCESNEEVFDSLLRLVSGIRTTKRH